LDQLQIDNANAQFEEPEEDNLINYPYPEGLCMNLGSWFCDNDKRWKNALIYGADVPVNSVKDLSTDTGDELPVVSPENPEGCCPSSYCFNGSSCEAPYADPQKPPFGIEDVGPPGYRCNREGQWAWSTLKFDWDFKETGYCLANTECYAPGRANCSQDGEWLFDGRDHYCEHGNWTSRTKYIAAKLRSEVADKDDFTLFCGDYGETLNEVTYQFAAEGEELFGPTAESIIKDSATNFCVLKIGEERVIAGTALKGDNPLSFLEAMGKPIDYCDDVDPDSDLFASCGGTTDTDAYYWPKKQIILFSSDDFIIDDSTGFETAWDVITNPFENFISAVGDLFADTELTVAAGDYIQNIKDFDKLYIAVKSGKSVMGVVETKADKETVKTYMAIDYTGFEQDFCQATSDRPGIACTTETVEEIKTTTMFSENPDDLLVWPDLTAKIRIK
jgi:hypothetical protein